MLEFKFDTQCLIEGVNLPNEDVINNYIKTNIKGDSLLAVGDDTLIKIHYHTNEPWKVIEYAASLGELHDVVIENMERQANGKKG
ncbi:MAG: kinase to dihydroxyacetone kinase [Bacilli bacterium]|nr:kinase to dihydroxyacetone kinase [Bacilli bacterium]